MHKDIYNKLIFGKYKLLKEIGRGSFGYVFKGKNIVNNEKVAIKIEDWKNKGDILESEAYFLYYLKGFGIPEVKSFGIYNKYKVLIQTLLGDSLDSIFENKYNYFNLKDVCMLGLQLIDRLEFIHSKNIIHRDIKPENILIDYETKKIIYLIDFGLAKKYRSGRTGKHIKFSIPRRLTGTAGFASANALRGTEQSRRDDLESLGYVLIYFLKRGELPWKNLNISNKLKRYRKIYEIKKTIKPEELCQDIPQEFCEYIKYVKNLQFEEDPNYNKLRGLMTLILEKNNYINDFNFSWLSNKERKSIKINNLNFKSGSNINLQKRKISPQARLLRNIQNSRERENNLEKINKNKLSQDLEVKQEKRENDILSKRKIQKLKNNNKLSIKNNSSNGNINSNISNNEKNYESFSENNDTKFAQFNVTIDIDEIEDNKNNNNDNPNNLNNLEKKDNDLNIENNNIEKKNENKDNSWNKKEYKDIKRPIKFDINNEVFKNVPLIKCFNQYSNKVNFGDINNLKRKRVSIENHILTENFIPNNIISKIKNINNKSNENIQNIKTTLDENYNEKLKINNIKINKQNSNNSNNKINLSKNKKKLLQKENQNNNIKKINNKKYNSPIKYIKLKENKINYGNNINLNINLITNNGSSGKLKKIKLKINNINNKDNLNNINIPNGKNIEYIRDRKIYENWNNKSNDNIMKKNLYLNYALDNTLINKNSNNNILNYPKKILSKVKNNSSNNVNKINIENKSLETNNLRINKNRMRKQEDKIYYLFKSKSQNTMKNKNYLDNEQYFNYFKKKEKNENKILNTNKNKKKLSLKTIPISYIPQSKTIKLQLDDKKLLSPNNNISSINFKEKYGSPIKYNLNKKNSKNNFNNIYNHSYTNSINNNYNFNTSHNNQIKYKISQKLYNPGYLSGNISKDINIPISGNNFFYNYNNYNQ